MCLQSGFIDYIFYRVLCLAFGLLCIALGFLSQTFGLHLFVINGFANRLLSFTSDFISPPGYLI